MFLMARMASTWTLVGRFAAAEPNKGRIFVIVLRLWGCPALPRTFRSKLISSMFSSATALAIFSWMGLQREIKNHSHDLTVIMLKIKIIFYLLP